MNHEVGGLAVLEQGDEETFDLCFNALKTSLTSIISANSSVKPICSADMSEEDRVRRSLDNAVRKNVRILVQKCEVSFFWCLLYGDSFWSLRLQQ